MDDDYYPENEGTFNVIPFILGAITVIIAVILVATAVLPVVHTVTHEYETNMDDSGIRLAYFDADEDVTAKQVKFAFNTAKTAVVATGDYSASILTDNRSILLQSDNSALVYADGYMWIVTDGDRQATNQPVTVTMSKVGDSIRLTYSGNFGTESYDTAVGAYFPEKDGEYSSYRSIDFDVSEHWGVTVPNEIYGGQVMTDYILIEKDGKELIYYAITR